MLTVSSWEGVSVNADPVIIPVASLLTAGGDGVVSCNCSAAGDDGRDGLSADCTDNSSARAIRGVTSDTPVEGLVGVGYNDSGGDGVEGKDIWGDRGLADGDCGVTNGASACIPCSGWGIGSSRDCSVDENCSECDVASTAAPGVAGEAVGKKSGPSPRVDGQASGGCGS